jgi:hypothetical protein
MKKFHLFISYAYFGTVEHDYLLDCLAKHEFYHSTTEPKVMTALDPDQGIAFSQEYQKLKPKWAQWSQMWKHLPGVSNPDGSSYDKLLASVPHPNKQISFLNTENLPNLNSLK